MARGHVEGTFNLKQPTPEPTFIEHRTFRSDHPGGVNFCFVDGSTHFVSDSIERETLIAFTTRNGGEIVAIDEL